MRFDIISIFPELFQGVFEYGIVRRAIDSGLVEVALHDLRDYGSGRHRQVDDRPFGGGPGMVMKPEPLALAIEDMERTLRPASVRTVLLSPQGRLFDQQIASEFSNAPNLILVCGRYEGIDERVVEHWIDDEISIGDYILTGGEIPAMVIVDSVTRLIPGSLGCEDSADRESFVGGLLDYPQYTRPAEYRGMRVPDILLSGNHAEIESWRRTKAIEKTAQRRPDLMRRRVLSDLEREIVEDISGQIDSNERG